VKTQDGVLLDVSIEERLPSGRTIAFGLQHLLALTGIWLFPILLGQALHLRPAQVSEMVQACFFTSGVVTVLQSSRLLRLPVVQGPTAAFFLAVLASGFERTPAGAVHGLGTAFGSMMVAASIAMLLALPIGRWGLMGRLMKFIGTPIVFGTLLLIIAASLASFGLSGWFGVPGSASYGLPSFLTSGATALVVLVCMIFGGGTLIGQAAFLLGIVFGTLVSWLTGAWSIPSVSADAAITLPHLFPFGFAVSPPVVALMLLAFLQAGAEATGMYTLLGRWTNQEITPERVNRGLFAEFAGCAAGAMFGGLGTTSYPENIGIIRITKIGSRFVTLAAGAIAVAMSLFPALSLFIAGLPAPVLAGASTILFGVIAISGVQMMAQVEWDPLNIAVAAPSFIIALGAAYIPQDILKQLAPAVGGLLKPMTLGTVMLITLNIIVNHVVRPRIAASASAAPVSPTR
jgi:uracil-xanthine permease